MNKQDRQNLWLLLMDIGKREKKTMMLIGAVSLVCSARPFISIMGMGRTAWPESETPPMPPAQTPVRFL